MIATRTLLFLLSAIVLACVLVPTELRAQGDGEPVVDLAQRHEAVREFRRYFRKFKEVEQKVEAVHTLRGNECVTAAEELVALFDDKEGQIRRAAIDVLSSYTADETFAALLEELPELKNQERRAVLIDVLGAAGIKSATPVIAQVVLEDRSANKDVKFAAAKALGLLGGEQAEPALAALLEESDAIVRMAAVDAVGALDIESLGAKIVELLRDPAWQVQVAAIKAAGAIRIADAVTPIIEIMAEGGRATEECADALFHITGMDLGTDHESWQKTWDRLSKISGWRIPTDAELAEKAASRKRYDALYGKVEDANSFGGIKTTSTKILFIIDVSGSMEDLVVDRAKFDAGYESYDKLTIVKTELLRTIETLDDNTMFNIAAFATQVKPWKRKLVPANIVNRASAKSFVEKLKPLGGKTARGMGALGGDLTQGKTNTHAALMYAFGINPEKSRGGPTTSDAARSNLDTVFFLSDGRPSTGVVVDERQILREINEINSKFRVVFHVIAIGDFQKAFLQSLAENNGGVFVDLGG